MPNYDEHQRNPMDCDTCSEILIEDTKLLGDFCHALWLKMFNLLQDKLISICEAGHYPGVMKVTDEARKNMEERKIFLLPIEHPFKGGLITDRAREEISKIDGGRMPTLEVLQLVHDDNEHLKTAFHEAIEDLRSSNIAAHLKVLMGSVDVHRGTPHADFIKLLTSRLHCLIVALKQTKDAGFEDMSDRFDRVVCVCEEWMRRNAREGGEKLREKFEDLRKYSEDSGKMGLEFVLRQVSRRPPFPEIFDRTEYVRATDGSEWHRKA